MFNQDLRSFGRCIHKNSQGVVCLFLFVFCLLEWQIKSLQHCLTGLETDKKRWCYIKNAAMPSSNNSKQKAWLYTSLARDIVKVTAQNSICCRSLDQRMTKITFPGLLGILETTGFCLHGEFKLFRHLSGKTYSYRESKQLPNYGTLKIQYFEDNIMMEQRPCRKEDS